MPKLPVVSSKRVIIFLEKRGFKIHRTSGSHVILYHSKDKRRVVVPFHKKDLPKGTLHSILKSAGINRSDYFSV